VSLAIDFSGYFAVKTALHSVYFNIAVHAQHSVVWLGNAEFWCSLLPKCIETGGTQAAQWFFRYTCAALLYT
jgi:hypothetical protein